MAYRHKDLLGLKDLTREEINYFLEQAKAYKEIFSRPLKQVPVLKGKSLMSLFFEPSTRTKSSFDQASRMLSCAISNLTTEASSTKKGETLIDTAKNLEVLGVSAFVIRHSMGGAPHLVARNVKIPVINAGDGFNEHPTQGLLDVFSMVDAKGDIAGKHVAIVGDIAHSRVARSNIWALTKLGAKVTVVAPPTLIPKGVEAMGVNVSYDLDEIIPQVDFINVLRMQLERQKGNLFPSQREYFKLFGITSKRLEKAKADMLVLHPGPINRGVEIASDVVDGSRNLILQQVTNGVAVRMAVLVALLSGQRNKNL